MIKLKNLRPLAGRFAGVPRLALVFMLIEFFDELVYAIGGAALPAIRDDLALSYAQIGLLLGLPLLVNSFLEPGLMLLGDTRLRKALIFGGGLVFAASLAFIAGAHSFPVILGAYLLSYPANGAFVSLSQGTLMDTNPGREAQMMARWTVAGSLGNLIGPLVLAGGFALAWSWRWLYAALAVAGLLLALVFLRQKGFPRPKRHETAGIKEILRNFWAALRNRQLIRLVVLLEFADLLMDIFFSYLPLYLVDVAGFQPAQAGVLVSAYIASSLVSDAALVWLLERVPGRILVRFSALAALALFPAFLLVESLALKIALLMLLPFAHLGWYAVLTGEAFAEGNGRSGSVMAVGSFGGLLNGALIGLVGWAAQAFGLPAAMWLLLLGPLSIALFAPKPLK